MRNVGITALPGRQPSPAIGVTLPPSNICARLFLGFSFLCRIVLGLIGSHRRYGSKIHAHAPKPCAISYTWGIHYGSHELGGFLYYRATFPSFWPGRVSKGELRRQMYTVENMGKNTVLCTAPMRFNCLTLGNPGWMGNKKNGRRTMISKEQYNHQRLESFKQIFTTINKDVPSKTRNWKWF